MTRRGGDSCAGIESIDTGLAFDGLWRRPRGIEDHLPSVSEESRDGIRRGRSRESLLIEEAEE